MHDQQSKKEYFNRIASKRDHWKQRFQYYHDDIFSLMEFLIPSDASIVEIGCGTGDLIGRLRGKRKLGVDFSEKMIEVAKQKYSHIPESTLEFRVDDCQALQLEEKFDYVILSDFIGHVDDIWQTFRSLKKITNPQSRIIISYYNALWEPLLLLAEKVGLKMPQPMQNWLSAGDVKNLLHLNGFDVITEGQRMLFPLKIPFLSSFLNIYCKEMPLLRKLSLVYFLVARPCVEESTAKKKVSVSVLIPCRNEKGNIRSAVARTPEMGASTEIIFVDGNSNDGTVEEIQTVMAEYKGNIKLRLIHQVEQGNADGDGHGKMLKLGKGDAVRKGFAAAEGDILMILDADLTVPPEDLPKFYQALIENKGDFINGTRLVYPMEKQAMRTLNIFGNKFFSLLFTWLLGQRVKDTLCGTKVLFKRDYEKIARNRKFFGDFDPFGDFDLLFGAAKQNMKIVEVPIRYRERTYGDVKIERFKHGLILLKMSIFAMRKLRFW